VIIRNPAVFGSSPTAAICLKACARGIEGYDAWNGGTALGADRVIFDHFTVGISGGSSYGRVNSKTQDARTDINNAQGAVYAGYQNPDLNYFINAAGTFAWDWYKGQRVITAGSITRMAFSNYDGQQYGTYLGGGYKIKFGDNLELTPLASLQWSHLSLSRYTETNAGALNLNVDSQSYDTVESGLGVGISSEIISYWGIFTPEFHVKWLYDYMNDRIAVNSSLAGGGGSFSSYGATPSKQGVGIGGKLTFDFINDISLIAGLDTELRDGFFGFYGSGTLRYRF